TARRVGQGRLVLVLALDGQDVGKVDRRRAYAHARLMRLERGKRDLFQSERADVFGDFPADNRLHAVPVVAEGWATCGKVRMPPEKSAVAKAAAEMGSRVSRMIMRSPTSNATPTMAAMRKSASIGGKTPCLM